jgi:hypothetical protein
VPLAGKQLSTGKDETRKNAAHMLLPGTQRAPIAA